MALIQCDFFSSVLGMNCSMDVILPQTTQGQIGMTGKASQSAHPTLWLLHGLSDDHTTWVRRTSIERYVAPLGLAVVMPNAGRSFYADMHVGPRYWTFLSEELPTIARSLFPLSDRREDNFVAGLSMGGYGAFKWALNQPEKFAAAASLSGALDVRGRARDKDEDEAAVTRREEMQSIFGDLSSLEGSRHDLFHAASQLVNSGGRAPPCINAAARLIFFTRKTSPFAIMRKTSAWTWRMKNMKAGGTTGTIGT